MVLELTKVKKRLHSVVRYIIGEGIPLGGDSNSETENDSVIRFKIRVGAAHVGITSDPLKTKFDPGSSITDQLKALIILSDIALKKEEIRDLGKIFSVDTLLLLAEKATERLFREIEKGQERTQEKSLSSERLGEESSSTERTSTTSNPVIRVPQIHKKVEGPLAGAFPPPSPPRLHRDVFSFDQEEVEYVGFDDEEKKRYIERLVLPEQIKAAARSLPDFIGGFEGNKSALLLVREYKTLIEEQKNKVEEAKIKNAEILKQVEKILNDSFRAEHIRIVQEFLEKKIKSSENLLKEVTQPIQDLITRIKTHIEIKQEISNLPSEEDFNENLKDLRQQPLPPFSEFGILRGEDAKLFKNRRDQIGKGFAELSKLITQAPGLRIRLEQELKIKLEEELQITFSELSNLTAEQLDEILQNAKKRSGILESIKEKRDQIIGEITKYNKDINDAKFDAERREISKIGSSRSAAASTSSKPIIIGDAAAGSSMVSSAAYAKKALLGTQSEADYITEVEIGMGLKGASRTVVRTEADLEDQVKKLVSFLEDNPVSDGSPEQQLEDWKRLIIGLQEIRGKQIIYQEPMGMGNLSKLSSSDEQVQNPMSNLSKRSSSDKQARVNKEKINDLRLIIDGINVPDDINNVPGDLLIMLSSWSQVGKSDETQSHLDTTALLLRLAVGDQATLLALRNRLDFNIETGSYVKKHIKNIINPLYEGFEALDYRAFKLMMEKMEEEYKDKATIAQIAARLRFISDLLNARKRKAQAENKTGFDNAAKELAQRYNVNFGRLGRVGKERFIQDHLSELLDEYDKKLKETTARDDSSTGSGSSSQSGGRAPLLLRPAPAEASPPTSSNGFSPSDLLGDEDKQAISSSDDDKSPNQASGSANPSASPKLSASDSPITPYDDSQKDLKIRRFCIRAFLVRFGGLTTTDVSNEELRTYLDGIHNIAVTRSDFIITISKIASLVKDSETRGQALKNIERIKQDPEIVDKDAAIEEVLHSYATSIIRESETDISEDNIKKYLLAITRIAHILDQANYPNKDQVIDLAISKFNIAITNEGLNLNIDEYLSAIATITGNPDMRNEETLLYMDRVLSDFAEAAAKSNLDMRINKEAIKEAIKKDIEDTIKEAIDPEAIKEAIKKDIKKYIEKDIKKATEEAAEEAAAEEAIKKAIKKATDPDATDQEVRIKVIEEAIEKAIEEAINQAAINKEATNQKAIEEFIEKLIEENIEETIDQETIEKAIKKAIEEAIEKSIGEAIEKAMEEAIEIGLTALLNILINPTLEDRKKSFTQTVANLHGALIDEGYSEIHTHLHTNGRPQSGKLEYCQEALSRAYERELNAQSLQQPAAQSSQQPDTQILTRSVAQRLQESTERRSAPEF